jgi:membrane-bound ClpP family serine protease
MEDLRDILENDNYFNEEELKKYLSGNASEEEKRAIEKRMVDSPFLDDAVEGLQKVSGEKLDEFVNHLNKQLRDYITGKKEAKEKRRIKGMSWIIIAVIIVLLLCILGYVVILLE